MSETRWFVSMSPSYTEAKFSDIGAHAMNIEHGALVFYDATGEITIALAPGTWVEVTRQED